tara:strand:- start:35 stop:556 length:522 start_codon:yes stop_codon:yes gene_type:complete
MIILTDRDGVINHVKKSDRYLTNKKQIKYIKKNIKGFKHLSQKNISFILITNQSCIAKNIISVSEFKELNHYMLKKLEGIKFLKTYFCPHNPEDKCNCRKPKTSLIERALNEFKIKNNSTYFIGDSYSDYIAALNSNITPVIIYNSSKKEECKNIPEKFKFHSVYEWSNKLNF